MAAQQYTITATHGEVRVAALALRVVSNFNEQVDTQFQSTDPFDEICAYLSAMLEAEGGHVENGECLDMEMDLALTPQQIRVVIGSVNTILLMHRDGKLVIDDLTESRLMRWVAHKQLWVQMLRTQEFEND